MRKPSRSKIGKRVVKKDIIEIESDSETDEVGCRILAICGEVNASHKPIHSSVETNKTSMQIVDVDGFDSGLEHDVVEYTKYLTNFSNNHQYLLEDSSPMRLMYNVENEANRSKGRSVKVEKSRVGSPLVSSVSKKSKTENGKSIARTFFKTKETKQNKEDARHGLKIALAKNAIKLKSTSRVKDTKRTKGETLREREILVTKNNVKASKKDNKKSSERNQRIASKRVKAEKTTSMVNTKRKKEEALRERKINVNKNNVKAGKKENEKSSERNKRIASKRVKIEKTIPMVVNTKRKKDENLREKKISMIKNNVKSKSRSYVKEESLNSFKARKKENEECLSSIDKSYEYYLMYLRNSITICESDRKLKDLVCLSDPDIIAISDYPFSDGGKSPFEANKDGKVRDLEDDGNEPEDIFNSSFSKKLLEILIKPYDKTEFVQLYNGASLKRQVTRSRQLRDGREIEYNVDDLLRLSYFEKYPDFNKVFRRYRYEKDRTKSLNLLRGFFFYIKNIVHEGAFKPWLYEKRVERECKVLYASSKIKLLHSS